MGKMKIPKNKKTMLAKFSIIPPPEKHVLASMNVEISTKDLKRRLPKPVLPESLNIPKFR